MICPHCNRCSHCGTYMPNYCHQGWQYPWNQQVGINQQQSILQSQLGQGQIGHAQQNSQLGSAQCHHNQD